ncbi:MAG: hypothetical protein MR871_12905 [Lachnospiraceae bacterium]|nr:hypothetical protein [Lachnospiraceae bacterium]MDD7078249.1 hypothetical protein [Lachnospiraceae bacterium]
MKKIIMSLIVILLVGALTACGMEMDGKNLNSSKKEETETQVSKELEKALSTEVEGSESESTVFETEEITSEGDYPGADVVEIVNLRGDETTVYKLADGTYMDRIDRRFTYNGTDTWTDEDGIEWNEAVKTSANDNSSNNVNEVPEGAGWKADLEKSLFENYGVVPKYYEDLGDGIYQVYVEVGGEVEPLVTVDSATGDYQVNW